MNPFLYLDLLKLALRADLWADPGKPIETVAYRAGLVWVYKGMSEPWYHKL